MNVALNTIGTEGRRSGAGRRLAPNGLLWRAVAGTSWAAFRLSRLRLQPEAIATGLPGLLWRLVLRPVEWALYGPAHVVGSAMALQAGLLIAIFGLSGVAATQFSPRPVRAGGDARPVESRRSPANTLPRRRETT